MKKKGDRRERMRRQGGKTEGREEKEREEGKLMESLKNYLFFKSQISPCPFKKKERQKGKGRRSTREDRQKAGRKRKKVSQWNHWKITYFLNLKLLALAPLRCNYTLFLTVSREEE